MRRHNSYMLVVTMLLVAITCLLARVPDCRAEPISCLATCSSSPLHLLYNPKSAISRSGRLISGRLTQTCIIFHPHILTPGCLDHLLANSRSLQKPHEGQNDQVSLGAKPSFAFDQAAYFNDKRLFFGIEAILASMECLNDAETMKIREFFARLV